MSFLTYNRFSFQNRLWLVFRHSSMLIDNFELVSYCEHFEVTLRSLTVEIDIIGCLDVFELPFREIGTDEVVNRLLDKNGGSCAF